jgi:DNA-binding transcriptional regulator WhiA
MHVAGVTVRGVVVHMPGAFLANGCVSAPNDHGKYAAKITTSQGYHITVASCLITLVKQ